MEDWISEKDLLDLTTGFPHEQNVRIFRWYEKFKEDKEDTVVILRKFGDDFVDILDDETGPILRATFQERNLANRKPLPVPDSIYDHYASTSSYQLDLDFTNEYNHWLAETQDWNGKSSGSLRNLISKYKTICAKYPNMEDRISKKDLLNLTTGFQHEHNVRIFRWYEEFSEDEKRDTIQILYKFADDFVDILDDKAGPILRASFHERNLTNRKSPIPDTTYDDYAYTFSKYN